MDPHEIGINLKPNDGKLSSKDLFVLFVGQANEIPELEESSEVGWKSLLIALVEHHLAPLLG